MKFDYKKLADLFLSERIKRDYIRKKYTGLREYSKEIEVSSSTLSRLGKCKGLDINTIFKICSWLNKPINYFIKK